jgi:hypothetical protein
MKDKGGRMKKLLRSQFVVFNRLRRLAATLKTKN